MGEYAIHTQCAWRITGPDGIAVAFSDRFTPRGNPDEIPEDLDCNQRGLTLGDERMETLLAHRGESLVVERVVAGKWGSFSLSLKDGFSLDIFPNDSWNRERWRWFRPRIGERHFVVAGSGIED